MWQDTPRPNFLGLSDEHARLECAQYAVLPIPYEGTVSYGTGTARGPDAILDASTQVEWVDEELLTDLGAVGIATCAPVAPSADPEEQMGRILESARPLAQRGLFVLGLGGEHSVTPPLVRAAAEKHGAISVLQIDAHADLRNAYAGTSHSHACAMRRVLEITDSICQVGIRSFSAEELRDCPAQARNFITASTIHTNPRWMHAAIGALRQKVYVTIDIDGLDPSIAPGTGTPEPGGLSWQQVTALLRRVCTERHVVAADIVEVAPVPGSHITEFVAARLACKLIAYTRLASARR